MVKRIAFTLLFCCLAVSAFAKDFGEFSVDLPDGWEVMNEVNQQGMVVAVMASEKDEAMLVVTVSPSSGQTAEELSDMTMEALKGQGAELKITTKEKNKVVYEGSQDGATAYVVFSTDPAAKQMATVTMAAADIDVVKKVVKTMKFKNSKLSAL